MTLDNTQDQATSSDTNGAGDIADAMNEADPSFITSDGTPKGPPRGAMLLIGLLVVGAAVVYFVYFRNGPASAQGGTSAKDAATIDEFLKVDSTNINLMKQTLKDSEKVVQQFLSYPGKTQVPLTDLHSNPFRELPPKDNGPVAAAPDPNARRNAAEREAAYKAIQTLQLQSVIHSSSRRACMINNNFVHEGQEFQGFSIDQIGANTVVVHWTKLNTLRFELKMQK
jgi:hypothetical protein